MEADESQQLLLKRAWVITLLTVIMAVGLITKQAAANETIVATTPPTFMIGDDRVELPAGKRQQFRAKLIRNWWWVKQPKYVIYRPLFQKG